MYLLCDKESFTLDRSALDKTINHHCRHSPKEINKFTCQLSPSLFHRSIHLLAVSTVALYSHLQLTTHNYLVFYWSIISLSLFLPLQLIICRLFRRKCACCSATQTHTTDNKMRGLGSIFATLAQLLLLISSTLGQCPWQRDVPDLQNTCLCAYNLGHEISIQCDQVRN